MLPLAFNREGLLFERVLFAYYNHDFYDYSRGSPLGTRIPKSEWLDFL